MVSAHFTSQDMRFLLGTIYILIEIDSSDLKLASGTGQSTLSLQGTCLYLGLFVFKVFPSESILPGPELSMQEHKVTANICKGKTIELVVSLPNGRTHASVFFACSFISHLVKMVIHLIEIFKC